MTIWYNCADNYPDVFREVLICGIPDPTIDEYVTTIGRRTFDSWEILADYEPVKSMKPIFWTYLPITHKIIRHEKEAFCAIV